MDPDTKGAVGFHALQEGLKKLNHLKPQIHLSNDDFKRITRDGELCNSRGQLESANFEIVMREEVYRFLQSRICQAYDECIQNEDLLNSAQLGGLKLQIKRESNHEGIGEDIALKAQEVLTKGLASVTDALRVTIHETLHTSLRGIRQELQAELHNLRSELCNIHQAVRHLEDLQNTPRPALTFTRDDVQTAFRGRSLLLLSKSRRNDSKSQNIISAGPHSLSKSSRDADTDSNSLSSQTERCTFLALDRCHINRRAESSGSTLELEACGASAKERQPKGSNSDGARPFRRSSLKIICEDHDEEFSEESNEIFEQAPSCTSAPEPMFYNGVDMQPTFAVRGVSEQDISTASNTFASRCSNVCQQASSIACEFIKRKNGKTILCSSCRSDTESATIGNVNAMQDFSFPESETKNDHCENPLQPRFNHFFPASGSKIYKNTAQFNGIVSRISHRRNVLCLPSNKETIEATNGIYVSGEGPELQLLSHQNPGS